MSTKKRPSSPVGKPQVKRLRRFQNDEFRTQDIWKNLDRVRTSNDNADAVLKNSSLFIPLLTRSAILEYASCVQALHEYIDARKLRLHRIKSDYGFIVLRQFSLLDCCLVLTVIMALKNKRWIAANSSDYFNVPSNVALSGTFYLPGSSTSPEVIKNQYPVSIITSRYRAVTDFEEFFIDTPSGVNLTPFMDSLSLLFCETKFGDSAKVVDRFRQRFKSVQESLDSSLLDSSSAKKLLLDMSIVAKENLPLLETSKDNLHTYAQDLVRYNNQTVLSENSTPKEGSRQSPSVNPSDAGEGFKRPSSRQPTTTSERTYVPNERANGHSRPDSGGAKFSPNSGFMTQPQIKDHCVATVKASMEVMKTKSPYQIFRLYVKCPRQNYIDIINQNLNDLRAQTNCNIVVLNLSNLHESDPWFDSLDVSPYTQAVQRPHPSTVRVISVGGIGEHMNKALDLIYKILSS